MTIFTNGMLSSAIKKSLWYVIIEESAYIRVDSLCIIKDISVGFTLFTTRQLIYLNYKKYINVKY